MTMPESPPDEPSPEATIWEPEQEALRRVKKLSRRGFLVAGMPNPKTSPSPSANEPTKFEKVTGRPDPAARPEDSQKYLDKLGLAG